MKIELMSATCNTLPQPAIDLSSSKSHCEEVWLDSNDLNWLQSIRLRKSPVVKMTLMTGDIGKVILMKNLLIKHYNIRLVNEKCLSVVNGGHESILLNSMKHRILILYQHSRRCHTR